MGGIAGGYGRVRRAQVQQMIACLLHRGPNGSAIRSTPKGRLGSAQLVLDESNRAQEPLEHEGAIIALNGEIYNHQALRERYLRGQDFATAGQAETILLLYRHYGPACASLLQGMFAFAILDQDELFLARDPLGIKPLYLAYDTTAIWFASEMRALRTVADTVEALPPGTWFHSRYRYRSYASSGQLRAIPEGFPSPTHAISAIRAILQTSVVKRVPSNISVGVSLSGGLDSSILALFAREVFPNLETFAVGMEGSDDIAAARDVARMLGTAHHEYIFTKTEIKHVLPQVISQLESAKPDLVRDAIPNYFLAQLASGRVRVMLTGEGADELYAGYDYLREIPDPGSLQHELNFRMARLHQNNLQRVDRIFMAFGIEGRVPFLDADSVAFAQSLPPEWKQVHAEKMSKWLLREAFAQDLPSTVTTRPQQSFSSGAGSDQVLIQHAESAIDDSIFASEQQRLKDHWGYYLTSKEELYYLQLLRTYLPEDYFL